LVAFGGAGPLHACALGSALDAEAVIVPPTPGVFSAYGLLLADVRVDESRAARERSLDTSTLAEQFASLARAVEDRLAGRGFDREAVRIERALDLRYVGQSYELTIPVAGAPVDAAAVAGAVERFHRRHEHRYGHAMPDEPVEAVTLRCSGVVPTETPEPTVDDDQHSTVASDASEREVYFAGDGFVPSTIRRRDGLRPGDRLTGPAIVEESGSTTVIPPGHSAVVSSVGSIVIVP
ncbi:MAG: hydantoinase/oxoprolinase family protein, partial [Halobacteriota archaeon]